VHGINAVLWAREAAFRREEFSPVSLNVNFLAPIYVGETAIAALERRSDSQLRININVGRCPHDGRYIGTLYCAQACIARE